MPGVLLRCFSTSLFFRCTMRLKAKEEKEKEKELEIFKLFCWPKIQRWFRVTRSYVVDLFVSRSFVPLL